MSTFVLKKEKKLELPNNYLEIASYEKEDIDGGYRHQRQVWIPSSSKRVSKSTYMNQKQVENIIASVVIGIATGGAGALLTVGVGWSLGIGAATSIITGLGGTGFNTAERLDRADGSYDGMLTVSWGGFWKTEYNPYPPNSWEGFNF